ncbi:MAG: hypothetical protein KGJ07_06855 [Patescibacteria group bacterium]|nr:hypothetical protein [Patescibacteria group bacterium]MDE2589753.1 hypothetical protein [Patescibacteria group bacterium]
MPGSFHLQRGGPEARPARPTPPEQRPFLFPSQTTKDGHKEYPGVIDQIQLLFGGFNIQPTDLRGKTSGEIVAYAQGKGHAKVNLATLQPEEAENVTKAVQIATAEGSPDLIATDNVSETSLMRTIVTEFVYNPVAQSTFTQYVTRLANEKPDLLENEYSQFVLGTPATRKAIEAATPLNVHYLPNLGLPKIQDQPVDTLRDKVVAHIEHMLQEMPSTVWDQLEGAISKSEQGEGEYSYPKVQVLMFGLLSNFLRGGVFYGFREGANMDYEPRRIASEMIHAARAEQEKAMQQQTRPSKRRWGAHN